MDNYRPISVLPVASKILERIVHCQLYQYLNTHHLFSPYQHGFRKKHSTESATLTFTDTIRRGIDQVLRALSPQKKEHEHLYVPSNRIGTAKVGILFPNIDCCSSPNETVIGLEY